MGSVRLFILLLLCLVLGSALMWEHQSSQTQSAMMQAERQVSQEKLIQSKDSTFNQPKIQSPQIQQPKRTKPLHVVVAARQLGIKESPLGSNRGDSIDAWWKNVSLRTWKSLPDEYKYWCGVYIHELLKQGKNPKIVRSALAKDYKFAGRVWTLQDVLMGIYHIKPGDLRIKSRPGGNHVDVFWSWEDKKGIVIGGNVSDRVAAREISFQSMIADKTTYIIEIEGYYGY